MVAAEFTPSKGKGNAKPKREPCKEGLAVRECSGMDVGRRRVAMVRGGGVGVGVGVGAGAGGGVVERAARMGERVAVAVEREGGWVAAAATTTATEQSAVDA